MAPEEGRPQEKLAEDLGGEREAMVVSMTVTGHCRGPAGSPRECGEGGSPQLP